MIDDFEEKVRTGSGSNRRQSARLAESTGELPRAGESQGEPMIAGERRREHTGQCPTK